MATRTSKLLIWLVGVRATRCWPWSVCSIARGLAALEPRHAGGPAILYDAAAKERILTEFRRKPDRERDGTATWSLTTLQRALRRAADGLPWVSTHTIWCVLHEAGLSWQRDRSWCQTGVAIRKRKNGEVEVHNPDTEAKKALIEQAYTEGPRLGLAVWGMDEGGPYQAIPQPGICWQPLLCPARYPHEHVRHGTAKLLTLFHPSTGSKACGIVLTPCCTPGSSSSSRRSWPAYRQFPCCRSLTTAPVGNTGKPD